MVEQPQETIYIGGQNGLDADGKVVGPTVGEQASHGGPISRPRRHHGYICAAQQVRELPGVGDRLVSEAVVHQHVDLAGALGQVLDLRHPLLQLLLLVVVAKALADGLLLPCLGVAAVEADHRQLGCGGSGERPDPVDQRSRGRRGEWQAMATISNQRMPWLRK